MDEAYFYPQQENVSSKCGKLYKADKKVVFWSAANPANLPCCYIILFFIIIRYKDPVNRFWIWQDVFHISSHPLVNLQEKI